MKAPIFCIDDGHPLDLKVAQILLRKNYKAIFYIPLKNSEGLPSLTKKEILYLSRHFEIGSHTFNHRVLTGLSEKKIRTEIKNGKEALEAIIGREVSSFCPPRGKYNRQIIKIAKDLGIVDIRSARILNFKKTNREGLWHPNLHLYPHPSWLDFASCIKNIDPASLIKRTKYYKVSHLNLYRIFKSGNFTPYFWLHSWEINKLGLWDLLSKI